MGLKTCYEKKENKPYYLKHATHQPINFHMFTSTLYLNPAIDD